MLDYAVLARASTDYALWKGGKTHSRCCHHCQPAHGLKGQAYRFGGVKDTFKGWREG